MYFRCKACNRLRTELEIELDEELCDECNGVASEAARELEDEEYNIIDYPDDDEDR